MIRKKDRLSIPDLIPVEKKVLMERNDVAVICTFNTTHPKQQIEREHQVLDARITRSETHLDDCFQVIYPQIEREIH